MSRPLIILGILIAGLVIAYFAPQVQPDIIEGKNVKLVYLSIETGCWTITITDPNPTTFLLLGSKVKALSPEKDNGKSVNFRGRVLKNIATTCMAGIPLEIISLEFVGMPNP